MRHFILTRHALAFGGVPPNREWIQQRRLVLVDLTARSLQLQTESDFTWLILADRSLAAEEQRMLSESLGD